MKRSNQEATAVAAAPAAAKKDYSHLHVTDRPLAADGLNSYRYKGGFGWVMIGAKDDEDALKQARRSVSTEVTMEGLQRWDGKGYVAAQAENATAQPLPAAQGSACKLGRNTHYVDCPCCRPTEAAPAASKPSGMKL